jgi:hypothetical protein
MRVLFLGLATVVLVCLVAATVLIPRATVEVGLGSGAPAPSVAISPPEKKLHPKAKHVSSWAMLRTEVPLPPTPATDFEPVANAKVGLTYTDLIERCGPPSMEITAEDGLKKLTYGSTRVLVREGMVTAIVVPNVRTAH